MEEAIKRIIQRSIDAKKQIPTEKIVRAIKEITSALRKGSKIMVCGNGGSAGDAQHMAGEFINRFKIERNPLPCIALTTDTSTITAIGNDYSFDEIFSKQVEALGLKNDILIGISTSGNSRNVIKALEIARKKEIYTICFLGNNGGQMKSLCDLSIIVNVNDTPRIQETHILIMHVICEIVEKNLFNNEQVK